MNGAIDDFDLASNGELENLQAGDDTATITVAVVRFDPRRARANAPPPRIKLLRVIGSNLQGSELRILFWENMADTYEGQLLKNIVQIVRPRVVAANPAVIDRSQNLLPIELSIQKSTTIKILEPMRNDQIPVSIPPQDVLFGDIGAAVGKRIRIVGYIKAAVLRAVVGNLSYGSGALTDGTYHLNVHITNFDQHNNPPTGAHVAVIGEVRLNRHRTLVLQVVHMTDINIVDDQIMDARTLKLGFDRIPQQEVLAVGDLNELQGAENQAAVNIREMGGLNGRQGGGGQAPANIGEIGRLNAPQGGGGQAPANIGRIGGLNAPQGVVGQAPAIIGGIGELNAPQGGGGQAPANIGGIDGLNLPQGGGGQAPANGGQVNRPVAIAQPVLVVPVPQVMNIEPQIIAQEAQIIADEPRVIIDVAQEIIEESQEAAGVSEEEAASVADEDVEEAGVSGVSIRERSTGRKRGSEKLKTEGRVTANGKGKRVFKQAKDDAIHDLTGDTSDSEDD